MAGRSEQESRAAATMLPRRQYHLPENFKELPSSHSGSGPIEGPGTELKIAQECKSKET